MKISLLGGWLAAATLAAATAAHAEHRDYPVSNITGLASSIPLDIDIVQDDRESLSLDGDDGQLAEVEVSMEGGTVRIRSRSRFVDWGKNVRGVLHTKQIASLHLAGTGSMRSASLRADELKASISGSGRIQVKRLDATNVNVVISGSGNVDLGSGRVENLNVTVTGAGDVAAGKLRSDAGKVTITGAGTTTLWPEKTLAVRITGVGTVRYFGDPQIVDRHIAGVGNVKRMQASASPEN
ncbi:MAG TPA: head GIN domain-containing protein [Usitatibacter sp.]|nr:head GIN domain-containing protein [Usitatibacter sp.]